MNYKLKKKIKNTKKVKIIETDIKKRERDREPKKKKN